MCHHKTCRDLKALGCNDGVACIPFNFYKRSKYVGLFGKERDGCYKDQLNLCAGKFEPQDNNCYLLALVRELSEEFKIVVNFKDGSFDNMFRDVDKNKLRYIIHNTTPVFIGVVSGLSRIPLNQQIFACNNDRTLKWSHQEMEFVDWIDVNTLSQIDNAYPSTQLSSFALGVIQDIIKNNILNDIKF